MKWPAYLARSPPPGRLGRVSEWKDKRWLVKGSQSVAEVFLFGGGRQEFILCWITAAGTGLWKAHLTI